MPSAPMITPVLPLPPLLPFIDPSTILKPKIESQPAPRLDVEPMDLSKSLKRPRIALSEDQPVDYSLTKKSSDVFVQHLSHVFGEKKKCKSTHPSPVQDEEEVEEDRGETHIEDSDPEEENDEEPTSYDSSLNKNSMKEYDEHRPITPISPLSSSPSTVQVNEKKSSIPDVPPTPASTIRSRDRYSCTYCPKTFPRSANLTRHLRTHTDKC